MRNCIYHQCSDIVFLISNFLVPICTISERQHYFLACLPSPSLDNVPLWDAAKGQCNLILHLQEPCWQYTLMNTFSWTFFSVKKKIGRMIFGESLLQRLFCVWLTEGSGPKNISSDLWDSIFLWTWELDQELIQNFQTRSRITEALCSKLIPLLLLPLM